MLGNKFIISLLVAGSIFFLTNTTSQNIPLPEHPRPDFERTQWVNLNGTWDFMFDNENVGMEQRWFEKDGFDQKIIVPFPWGSELSGVGNKAEIDMALSNQHLGCPMITICTMLT